eukprot:762851-Hanusia_phi.AAC.4
MTVTRTVLVQKTVIGPHRAPPGGRPGAPRRVPGKSSYSHPVSRRAAAVPPVGGPSRPWQSSGRSQTRHGVPGRAYRRTVPKSRE